MWGCHIMMPLSMIMTLLDAGSLNIPSVEPANFTFLMDSDDGSLLMIDGDLVISDPGAVLSKQLSMLTLTM